MRSGRAATALVALLVAAFMLFFALPLAGLIERGLREGDTWELATGASARRALLLSLWTATLATAVAVVLGTPVAYLLARAEFPGRRLADALIDLPILLPPTVGGVALLAAFGRRGLLGEPVEDWTGFTFGFRTLAVVMAQVFVAAPFYVRAARGGFAAIDPTFERVASTLGASRLRSFARVVVPLAWPSLLAGIVLCWARAMGELGATLIFAGSIDGRTRTMPLAILDSLEGGDGLAGAVALSLVLLATGLLVLWALRLVESRAARP